MLTRLLTKVAVSRRAYIKRVGEKSSQVAYGMYSRKSGK